MGSLRTMWLATAERIMISEQCHGYYLKVMQLGNKHAIR